MATYLLAWNPRRYQWGSLQDELRSVGTATAGVARWSVGHTRAIVPGDRFFMIRLGEDPRGLVAKGTFLSPPYMHDHWDRDRAVAGDQALYADIRFDYLAMDPVVPMELLRKPPLDDMHWSTQSSGIGVPERISDALDAMWPTMLRRAGHLPGELPDVQRLFVEGAVQSVRVDRLERSAGARDACVAEHGSACVCCGMSFAQMYGEIADGFIHVHHRRPLHEVKAEHEVDATRDLVPVCPNCHAVIHMRDPALSVDDVRDLLKRQRQA